MSEIDKPIGGTEIQHQLLQKYLGNKLDDFNIMVTYGHLSQIRDDKINVLWQHNGLDDHNMIKMMKYKPFIEQIDQFVFVSHFQYDIFSRVFNIPSHRCHVIHNAIEPVKNNQEKSKDKIKLVYTSTPWRGLSLLLEAFERLNRNDIELSVFSGTKIYGKDFYERNDKHFTSLYERAKDNPNVNYVDYATNEEVKQSLNSCHIMAYPSIFEETSCLAAIEAMSSGCKFVGSNLGALFETVNIFGNLIPIDRQKLTDVSVNLFIDRFVSELNREIDNFWSDETQSLLNRQIEYTNSYYDWNNRVKHWDEFIEISKKQGKI